MHLKLCTFNILAPCWAHPSYYPASSSQYLDRIKRRESIINVLKYLSLSHDMIALQEIQYGEITYIREVMKQLDYDCFHIYHEDTYWKDYVRPDIPFVSNGVALFWKSKKISLISIDGNSFSNGGNRCIIGLFRLNEKIFRVTCVHLDKEKNNKELMAILDYLNSSPSMVDIILGDFNHNINYEPYSNILKTNKFTNLLNFLDRENITHPFGIIDHILVRNAIPDNGQVLDFGILQDGNNDQEKFNLMLQRIGSDHFVVSGSIML